MSPYQLSYSDSHTQKICISSHTSIPKTCIHHFQNLTNYGKQWQKFVKQIIQKVAEELDIKHKFVRPYHPQSNGTLEKNPLIPKSLY